MTHAIVYDKATGEIRRTLTRNIGAEDWNLTVHLLEGDEARIVVSTIPIITEGKKLIISSEKLTVIDDPDYIAPPDYKAQWKAATNQEQKNAILAKMLKLEDE